MPLTSADQLSVAQIDDRDALWITKFVVSVRFFERDFRRLVGLAQGGRRNLSQTVRLLLETVLRDERRTV